MKISVSSNVDDLVRRMRDVRQRQLAFATAKALTATAQAVQAAEVKEMADVFDRPTPYTLSGTFVKSATKDRLTAVVGLKDFAGKGTPASKFLTSQIRGGARNLKRFERALRSVGALPDDMRAVPGSGAKLDAYGNMDRGQIVQILSYFRAFPEAGYRANMSERQRARLARGSRRTGALGFAYFVGRPGDGKLPLGIWQRFRSAHGGTALKPVLIFVRWAQYQAIFDFEFVARTTIEREWPRQFERAWAEAMGSAR